MLFKKTFSATETVSQYLQDSQLDFAQATRLILTMIPEVAAISPISVGENFVEAKALAISCNKVLAELNSCDDFTKKHG